MRIVNWSERDEWLKQQKTKNMFVINFEIFLVSSKVKEMTKWLNECGIQYEFFSDHYISFRTKKEAMLFKVMWL